ncbi:MAG: pilus assembly protein N-terminal domain-containing protein [Bauldia sp.]|nr:pilus assembly protein N-terminal domain-containing protein [Bauldia sp.]
MRHGGPVRSSLVAGAIAVAALVAAAFGAAAQEGDKVREPVLVILDQATLLRFDRAAETVIIGNPAIADVAIMNAQTIVLTGKSFGTTNLIVLDENGAIITEELVTVGSTDLVVTVYRRSVRETYSCSPICQPTLAIGDDVDVFRDNQEQIGVRNGAIEN